MDQYWRVRSTAALWVVMLLALAYSSLLLSFGSLTGEARLDGAISVLIGLYVCSHPASNVLDLLFVDGGVVRRGASDERGGLWYALNFLVLLSGWLVVLLGVIAFTT